MWHVVSMAGAAWTVLLLVTTVIAAGERIDVVWPQGAACYGLLGGANGPVGVMTSALVLVTSCAPDGRRLPLSDPSDHAADRLPDSASGLAILRCFRDGILRPDLRPGCVA